MDQAVDPILKYLLEYNAEFDIEYTSRYVIPVGGLQKMLDNFDQYHLNRVEVTKDELIPPKTDISDDVQELYDLID